MAQLTGSLTATGLRKSFRKRTILDFDFELGAGEFCLLLGENGVGKSTFFRCLLGLENFEGRVEVRGCRRYGQVFGVLDEPMMYPRWTVAQNIRYLLNDSHADRSDAVSELIDPSFLRRRAASLSTGEKKMVLLAAAMASDARFVLLDEFANGLDQRARAKVRDVIGKQLGRGRRGFIATGHDLGSFGDLPTRVVALQDGRLTVISEAGDPHRNIGEIYEDHVARTHS